MISGRAFLISSLLNAARKLRSRSPSINESLPRSGLKSPAIYLPGERISWSPSFVAPRTLKRMDRLSRLSRPARFLPALTEREISSSPSGVSRVSSTLISAQAFVFSARKTFELHSGIETIRNFSQCPESNRHQSIARRMFDLPEPFSPSIMAILFPGLGFRFMTASLNWRKFFNFTRLM
ncbi:MAG: hypothetical protein A2117_01470 [Candidatus Wildermuthbacteria bacterium GWA2_46_15]|uniref:Uncharacterized protein n=1 Tax=Candidatus Wildermuthbacteria bacterium GWA2_46_15 TaxID=1802443 RepID=A0A1G2QQ58_9BACT|nr:MAG: hypothetical protein A2117_01470 [Candidatus Wildermuthbacteria bacterium GWA2_46_15]